MRLLFPPHTCGSRGPDSLYTTQHIQQIALAQPEKALAQIDLAQWLKTHAADCPDMLTGSAQESVAEGEVKRLLLTDDVHEHNLTQGPVTISDDSRYHITSYYSSIGTSIGHTITVTGGSPHIYLEDISIISNGPAINVTGGTPTIHVVGNVNHINSSQNTGIAVSGGATLTIVGNSGTEDYLQAGGGAVGSGADATMGAGIGSPTNGAKAGNIIIKNVRVRTYGGKKDEGGGAGIGSSSNGPCGDITIENADIFARGDHYAAAIGMGCNTLNQTTYAASIGNITITNSTVDAKGYMGAAAIGFPYSMTQTFNESSGEYEDAAAGTYRAGLITINNSRLTLAVEEVDGTVKAQQIGKGAYKTGTTPKFLHTEGTEKWKGVVIDGTTYLNGVETWPIPTE